MSPAAENRADAIRRFAGPGGDYYVCAFRRIGERRGYAFSLNRAAALGGPVWLGARRLWGAFWPFLIAKLVAWIVIALALGSGVNAEAQARVERLETLVQTRQAEAVAALAGDPQAAVTQSLVRSVESLERALEQARDAAEAAGGSALPVLVVGIIGIAAVRLLLGALANGLLERRFRVWRIDDDEKHAGPDFSLAGGAAALVLTLLVIPTAALRSRP